MMMLCCVHCLAPALPQAPEHPEPLSFHPRPHVVVFAFSQIACMRTFGLGVLQALRFSGTWRTLVDVRMRADQCDLSVLTSPSLPPCPAVIIAMLTLCITLLACILTRERRMRVQYCSAVYTYVSSRCVQVFLQDVAVMCHIQGNTSSAIQGYILG